MYQNRLPLVPPDILQAHMVHEPGDTRFKAAARLLQALWRAERGIPMGTHVVQPKAEELTARIKEGYLFLAYGIDTVFLNAASLCPKY